ncbi:MAG: hypothetical protein DDT38_00882 [Firmicutes bacterium]|nr:hypothetical protein [candidate division NPL-UPA2 bacterium]
MLSVNECCYSAVLLRLGDDVECHCGLAARLRAIDFNYTSARHPAHA